MTTRKKKLIKKQTTECDLDDIDNKLLNRASEVEKKRGLTTRIKGDQKELLKKKRILFLFDNKMKNPKFFPDTTKGEHAF